LGELILTIVFIFVGYNKMAAKIYDLLPRKQSVKYFTPWVPLFYFYDNFGTAVAAAAGVYRQGGSF